MKTKLKSYFFTGLLSLLPIVLTISFFVWTIGKMATFISTSYIIDEATNFLTSLEAFEDHAKVEVVIKIILTISAIIVIATLITLIGFALKLVVGRKIAEWIHSIFVKIPIIKFFYTTLNQIIGVLFGNKGMNSFQQVVLLEYPRKGIYSIGFITLIEENTFNQAIAAKSVAHVFVPTAPNPTSGMALIMPMDELRLLNMSVEDAVKLIISAGAVSPKDIKLKIKE